MYFLIDSANLDEIRQAMGMVFVNGVTTNTREVSYHGGDDLASYIKELRSIARGTIHVQVTTTDAVSIVEEGRALSQLADNLRVKIPVLSPDCVEAIKKLNSLGIETAATAVNTTSMAILAAEAGAKSVIPYYGALENFEVEATSLLSDIKLGFKNYGYTTEIIFFAANVKQVRAGILAGVEGCLMTLDGLRSLFDHPLSRREVDFMNSEWRKRFGEKTWASLDVIFVGHPGLFFHEHLTSARHCRPQARSFRRSSFAAVSALFKKGVVLSP